MAPPSNPTKKRPRATRTSAPLLAGVKTGNNGKWKQWNIAVITPPGHQLVYYGKKSYRIQVPWLFWVIQVTHDNPSWACHASVEWLAMLRDLPVRKQMHDRVFHQVPLPNIYESGTVCPGTGFAILPAEVSLSTAIAQTMIAFWDSKSNNEVPSGIVNAYRTHKSAPWVLKQWEGHPESIPWRPYDMVYKEALEDVGVTPLKRRISVFAPALQKPGYFLDDKRTTG